MICNYCGSEADNNAKFCPFCGQPLNPEDNMKDYQQKGSEYNKTSSSAFYKNPNGNSTNTNFRQAPTKEELQKSSNDAKSIISLICGIISIFFCTVIFFATPIGICGIVASCLCKKKNKLNIAGLITSIIGTVLSIICTIIFLFIIVEANNFHGVTTENSFYEENYDYVDENLNEDDVEYKYFFGDSFKLPYDSSGTLKTLAMGKPCISYSWGDTNCYISCMDESALPSVDGDFYLYENQENLYDEFRKKWDNINNGGDTIKIWDESYGFFPLNPDILYAYYDFGVDEYSIEGRYYLLMDIEKNALLSFFVSNPDNSASFYAFTESVLRNIIISDDFYAKEETLDAVENLLDARDPWNLYNHLRSRIDAEIPVIEGGWRFMGASEAFYEFRGNEFWWYKSYNDLDDNYWYGETDILTGEKGLEYAGLNPNAIDEILKNSNGTVEADDIYTIICRPSKIISDGIDKSDTNIEEGLEWILCWILVDHGEEGIEGKVLNVNNGSESTYVKLKD